MYSTVKYIFLKNVVAMQNRKVNGVKTERQEENQNENKTKKETKIR